MTASVLIVGGGGYVGTYLARRLADSGKFVDICDSNGSTSYKFPFRYQELTAADLEPYDQVLWFAGHSSVASSVSDPVGALRNNCLDLFEFAQRMRRDSRLIYASTASLYSQPANAEASGNTAATESAPFSGTSNAYDFAKAIFDQVSAQFLENYVALRMGTVSGFSVPMREELVFNAMCISAIDDGLVSISSSDAQRTLLFLEDLFSLIIRLLEAHTDFVGILNAGSYSTTIGDLGARIARFFDVRLDIDPTSTSDYTFVLDTALQDSLVGPSASRRTLEDQCAIFSAAYLTTELPRQR